MHFISSKSAHFNALFLSRTCVWTNYNVNTVYHWPN